MKKRKTNSTYTDQDYWTKLNDQEKEWLRDFNRKEYYNGSKNHEINEDLFTIFRNIRSINENFDETQIQEAVFVEGDSVDESPEYLSFYKSLTKKQKRQFVRVIKLLVERIAESGHSKKIYF